MCRPAHARCPASSHTKAHDGCKPSIIVISWCDFGAGLGGSVGRIGWVAWTATASTPTAPATTCGPSTACAKLKRQRMESQWKSWQSPCSFPSHHACVAYAGLRRFHDMNHMSENTHHIIVWRRDRWNLGNETLGFELCSWLAGPSSSSLHYVLFQSLSFAYISSGFKLFVHFLSCGLGGGCWCESIAWGAAPHKWAPSTPHFAWQAGHLATSTFVSRGRCGTWSHPPSFCVAGVALLALGWLWWRAWSPVTVAGVALGAIHLRFAWQARHLWHWSGGTPGLD